jgi:cation diffusion facilitator CzcD-associated flavoprotein CzcO
MTDVQFEVNSTNDYDVIVVGAGFAGLYALYHLRELGFSVRVLETGDGVGGTWYWNRYPGARCDVQSLEYSYSFSKELQEEWEWTEVMPAQEEVERYLNHVADRFDLRRDIQLSTRVTAATFDESANRWVVETEAGELFSAPFCVMATGCLSAPMLPEVPGRDSFEGLVLQTSRWPREPVDLSGKRVALIGTGSSGVQTATALGPDVEHLYVFQRTATYTFPVTVERLTPEKLRETKDNYEDLRRRQRESQLGLIAFGNALLPTELPSRRILETPVEERLALVDQLGWGASRAWADVQSDPEANEAGVELYREMIRRTVKDPETAEALSPRGYPMGCKRTVIDTGYFRRSTVRM